MCNAMTLMWRHWMMACYSWDGVVGELKIYTGIYEMKISLLFQEVIHSFTGTD